MKTDGFEVVCPDGKVRHYPYHNEGDAECDARVYEERGCNPYPKQSAFEVAYGACPGGKHVVRKTAFEDGPERLS